VIFSKCFIACPKQQGSLRTTRCRERSTCSYAVRR